MNPPRLILDGELGISKSMKKWLSDVFKIACGVCLGYVFLIIVAYGFDDIFLPAIRVIADWITGDPT